MTTRPRGVDRSYWFGLPREYRRIHAMCCIGAAHVCPVCRTFDHDCADVCGCYARDPGAWREAAYELAGPRP